jgi:transcriptional antiterminator RfaH
MNWFAIHVKRFRETLAASSVATLGLEVFLPMVRVDKLEQVTIKVGSKPLFPSYFFAKFSPEIFLAAVDHCSGVLRVVRSGPTPVPVDDQVVQEIQEQVREDGLITIDRHRLKTGDQVLIQCGPFEGMMARVERELDDNKRVAILLETLAHARVLIEKRLVQVAG